MLDLVNTNGLKIKATKKDGRIYVIAKCQSSQGNLEVAYIPAEYGMYWYPLSFYFDYYYVSMFHNIMLKVDPIAPREIQERFKDNHHFLHNYYEYKKDELGTDKSMYMFNLGITTKLKSMGLKTWDGFYTLQDVQQNYLLLSQALDDIEQKIIKREHDEGINPNALESNPTKFATKDEMTMLSDLGMGFRMNQYMRKVAKIIYEDNVR